MSSTSQAINETRLRVRYAETDKMGVVYHSNHFIWFELGRVELLRQMGFSYRDMEDKDGCYIAVAEAKCRYRAPAYYDEEVLVRTRAPERARIRNPLRLRTVPRQRRRPDRRRRNHAHRHRFKYEGRSPAGKIPASVPSSPGPLKFWKQETGN